MSSVSAAKKAKKRPPTAPGFNKHGQSVAAAAGAGAASPSPPPKKARTDGPADASVPEPGGGVGGSAPVPVANHASRDDRWTVQDSARLYHIDGWGAPYFRINEDGNVEVDPSGTSDSKQKIDLFELVEDVIKRGHNLPLLIRFDDILADRIRLLNESFAHAIEEHKYKNVYRGVFPVKVCQQRHVVEEIVKFGAKYQYGLEAGSKPELLIVLAFMSTPGALITCNGYKDSEYIETALLAKSLGQNPIIIIEKLYEIDIVIEASKKLKITPVVGVRAKLTTMGMGRWGGSTGDHAKFGLSAAEIVEVVKRLKAVDLLSSLQLLHFHIGSQISRISVVKDALREAGQFFVELHKLGCDMKYLDVGGGLGIDYDGSKTSFHASMNYTIAEYAADVVVAIQKVCNKHGIPVPCLVSESGRAIASHMTVLVMATLGGSSPVLMGKAEEPDAKSHQLLKQLYETFNSINPSNLQECYHDATQYKGESLTLFTLGLLTLEERSKAEELYWCCCRAILPLAKKMRYVPEELQHLEQLMSSIYYCNFSVFQSAPDNWAIDQLFPIMPIHRLNTKPTQLAILADLTCDSDGKIDQFICSGTDDVKSHLEVHELEPNKPYYIGMFLNGAYQEVLGNLHNLYGDTNVIHICRDPKTDRYIIDHVIKGDTTEEVLRWMQYDPKAMAASIRQHCERAIGNGITVQQYKLMVRHYEKSLQKYTYLWADED